MSSPSESPEASWPGLDTARRIAGEHGAQTIGTQHLLLTLLSGPDDQAQAALRGAGVDYQDVQTALEAVIVRGVRRDPIAPHQVGVSERVEAILTDARRRGDQEMDGPISDRDVLGALLGSNDPAVARLILAYIGARRRTLTAIDTGRPPPLWPAADELHWGRQG